MLVRASIRAAESLWHAQDMGMSFVRVQVYFTVVTTALRACHCAHRLAASRTPGSSPYVFFLASRTKICADLQHKSYVRSLIGFLHEVWLAVPLIL
jgi:hypothetical protein